MGLPQFQLLPLLSLLQASSMLRMSLDSSALDTRTSTLPRLKLRMLLERPEEVTSMLMPMEFSRLSTTLLMTSMDSELLEPTSQLPLRLLLLLDQLLLLQLLWLHQWPLRRHLKWLLLELNILLLMLKPRLTVWKREKLSLLMEIMKFLLPLSFTILFRPSLPQHPLLLPSQIPTSFLLTISLPLGSLPLFLPLLLNLSLTKLLLPLPPLLP